MTDPVAVGETSRTIRRRPSFKMSQRSVRFLWAVALLAFLGVALVLGFVVALASGETALYERNFVWLFWINAVVALALLIVLVGATIRLGLRWRSGKFGSRLLLKLAAIFALVGVVPGALIYTVSLQFVTRSIDAWFDTKVDNALVAGLNLGKGTLDTLSADLVEQGAQRRRCASATRTRPAPRWRSSACATRSARRISRWWPAPARSCWPPARGRRCCPTGRRPR